jgi:fructokinase
MDKLFGAIEAGGTKFVCATGRFDDTGKPQMVAQTRIPTTTPAETMPAVLAFFAGQPALRAVGIGSFGPIDLHRNSPTWGQVTRTPKPGWSNAALANRVQAELGVPVGFDTDVNASVLAESLWGAGQGLKDLLYLVVGTGIGGGAMVNGQLLHGLLHSEMGHFLLAPRADDGFAGHCPFHGNCLEGLASGPAIRARWGIPAEAMPADHAAWDLEAHYIAQALHAFVCLFSPQRIILGSGVMQQSQLFPLVRQKLLASLNQYVQHPALLEHTEQYVVPAALGQLAGLYGAFELGRREIRN